MPIFNYLWPHFSNKSVWKLIPYRSVVRPHFSSTVLCNLVLPVNIQVLNETNWEDNNSQSLKNKNFANVLYQSNGREQNASQPLCSTLVLQETYLIIWKLLKMGGHRGECMAVSETFGLQQN